MARKRPICNYLGKKKELADGDSLSGYTSQSTNYAQAQGINIIDMDASGGARTVTLLTGDAFGAGNKVVIRKTDTSANFVTVSVTSSGTINGLTSYDLMVKGDSVTLMSDGTNHIITSNYTPAIWSTVTRAVNTNYTPSTTRNMRIAYTLRINLPSSASAQGGRIEVRSDSAATPTTMVTQARQTQDIGGLLSGGLSGSTDAEVTYDVVAGDKIRLVPVTENGSPTFSVVIAKERPI